MKKLIFILLVLLTSVSVVFADNIDNLKQALQDKNVAVIQTLLDSTTTDESADFESLILEEAKNAVAQDDLDYASTLAEMVLMFNFDNQQAQKLYTSTEKAKKSKADAELRKQEEERQRQLEEERKAAEEEQKRQLEEYQEQKKQEEQAKNEYIESVSSINFSNFPLSGGLNIPLEFFNSSFANQFNNTTGPVVKFGVGAQLNAGFNHPYFKFNLHANVNFFPPIIAENGMKFDLKTRATLGLPFLSKWLRFSVGINTFKISDDKNSALYTALTSPTIGIGFEEIKFANNAIAISTFADLNLITFDQVTQINYAFDVQLTVRYYLPFIFGSNGKVYIEDTTMFNTIVLSKQSEWDITTTLCAGVSFNE